MNVQALLRRYRGARLTRVGRRAWYVGRISQAEASAATGISLRNWQNWEAGHRSPRGLALEALLARLKRKA